MKIVTTENGFVLVFKDLADLQTVTEHLNGMVEAAETGDLVVGRYIYGVFPDDILNLEEREALTHLLKIGQI